MFASTASVAKAIAFFGPYVNPPPRTGEDRPVIAIIVVRAYFCRGGKQRVWPNNTAVSKCNDISDSRREMGSRLLCWDENTKSPSESSFRDSGPIIYFVNIF